MKQWMNIVTSLIIEASNTKTIKPTLSLMFILWMKEKKTKMDEKSENKMIQFRSLPERDDQALL